MDPNRAIVLFNPEKLWCHVRLLCLVLVGGAGYYVVAVGILSTR